MDKTADRARSNSELADGLAASRLQAPCDENRSAALTVLRHQVRVERVVPLAGGWHVAVRPVIVTAGSGRQSGHAVWSCSFCGCAHRAVLAVPLPDRVVRRSPCTGGKITMHVTVVTP